MSALRATRRGVPFFPAHFALRGEAVREPVDELCMRSDRCISGKLPQQSCGNSDDGGGDGGPHHHDGDIGGGRGLIEFVQRLGW